MSSATLVHGLSGVVTGEIGTQPLGATSIWVEDGLVVAIGDELEAPEGAMLVDGRGAWAVPGLIDWLAIPSGTRAKAVGAWHGIGNVIVIVLFAISLFLRWDDPGAPPVAAFVLSYGGVALALVTAWLGGELVDRLGVGVDTGAHLNAPSSLSDLPASAASEGRLPTGPATAD